MERCTGPLLENYLSTYGWTFRASGNQEWKTAFQGQDQSFPLRIHLTDTWISFVIEPYLNLDIDWESWPEISRCLLELNGTSSMVRLSLCGKGQIEMGLEALNNRFCYESFCTCMGLLGFYADQFYDEILGRLDSIGFRYSESLKLLT